MRFNVFVVAVAVTTYSSSGTHVYTHTRMHVARLHSSKFYDSNQLVVLRCCCCPFLRKLKKEKNPNYGVARFSIIIYIAIMHFRCRRRYTDWFDIVSFRCNNVQSLNKYTHTTFPSQHSIESDWHEWVFVCCLAFHRNLRFPLHNLCQSGPSSLSTILSAQNDKTKLKYEINIYNT